MESIFSGQSGGSLDEARDFGSLYDTKAFRILQVMLPFFPTDIQPALAVGIRLSQLQLALSVYKKTARRYAPSSDSVSKPPDPDLIFESLKTCLSPSEYAEMERMRNMFSMMRRLKDLEPILSQFGGFSEDMSVSDMMEMISNLQGMSSAFDSETPAQPNEKKEEERKNEPHEQRLDEG